MSKWRCSSCCEIGRQRVPVNYGTGTLDRNAQILPSPRSDDVLVTSTEYNAAGEGYKAVDPAGRQQRQNFDHAGRVLRTVDNFVTGFATREFPDQDVTVERSYAPDGQLATLTARNPATGDQVTRYVYGTASQNGCGNSSVARSDLLRAAIYPDSDDAADLTDGDDGRYDRVEYDYNRQGEVTCQKDQNGTLHKYSYDLRGRLVTDLVDEPGEGIDAAVIRIDRTFNARGLLASVSSCSDASGHAVVNQVLREYDGLGNLLCEHQEHAGQIVIGTSLAVEYAYDESVAGTGPYTYTKALRPVSIEYPNGRFVYFTYGSGGSAADQLNRLDEIRDDDGTTALARYRYLGRGTIVQEAYPEPDLTLDYFDSLSGQYAGVDRFGRIVNQLWKHGGAAIDQYAYGYDRASSRTYRENTQAAGLDELYTYDGMNQLVLARRGDLDASKTRIPTPVFAQHWLLDATGNWANFKEGPTDGPPWTLDQARTHNAANETLYTSGWSSPLHDRAGNMMSLPKPSDPTSALRCVYDGWKRLVQVKDGPVTVARYDYDGLNRRIVTHFDSQSPDDPQETDSHEHRYYNAAWQLLETRESESAVAPAESLPAEYQYVWSLRYIDAPVLRDDAAVAAPHRRVYYLTDAAMNVTGLATASGAVVERYAYDPYGRPSYYGAEWSISLPVSAVRNRFLYTGRELDLETGLFHYRTRQYSADLGRFITRDPLRYDAILYRYCGNRPIGWVDPLGLKDVAITGPTLGGDVTSTTQDWMIKNIVDQIMKSGHYPESSRQALTDYVRNIFYAGCIGIASLLLGNPIQTSDSKGNRKTVPNVTYCCATFAEAAAVQKLWNEVQKCKCGDNKTSLTGAPGRARIFAMQYSTEGIDPTPDKDGRYDLTKDPEVLKSIWDAPAGNIPFDFFFFSEEGDPWYNAALPWIHANEGGSNMVVKAADDQGVADQLAHNKQGFNKMFYCVACSKAYNKSHE